MTLKDEIVAKKKLQSDMATQLRVMKTEVECKQEYIEALKILIKSLSKRFESEVEHPCMARNFAIKYFLRSNSKCRWVNMECGFWLS